MAKTVQKWGNSLAVRLPRDAAETAQFAIGSKVEFYAALGEIKIRSAAPHRRRRSKYTFKEIWGNYKGPSPYRHLDRDPPVGKELL